MDASPDPAPEPVVYLPSAFWDCDQERHGVTSPSSRPLPSELAQRVLTMGGYGERSSRPTRLHVEQSTPAASVYGGLLV